MPVVDVDRLKEQGRRFVDGFTPGQKAMTILGVVAVVLAGMTFMKWAAQARLRAALHGPELAGRGRGHAGARRAARQVPDHRRRRRRSSCRARTSTRRASTSARRTSPPAATRSSLLDKQGITTDQFTRNIDYQRALQGELGKAIESIDSVAAATVTLTIPQQTVFVGATEDKPTAAVLVKTTGGDAARATRSTRSCTSSRRASRT